MMVENLDVACAELGAKLGASGNKDTENSITNALGVLEEQGLYALFLYLIARESGKFVPAILQFMEDRCDFRNGQQLYQKLITTRRKLKEAESKAKSRGNQSERDKARKEVDDARKVANESREAFFKALTDHARDPDNLLFTRDLLHRALVYARYHAKAAQVGGDGT